MRNTAEVICDSINSAGVRITTFVLEYPLYIHNQLLTHRMFSRSSSSSRAIPVIRLIDEIERDPAIPEVFRMNQKGMSPSEPLNEKDNARAINIVKEHMNNAFQTAIALSELGVHKQWANRYLAPFSHIRTVVTATDWLNFYDLRDSEHAQDEIALLAVAMKAAHKESVPSAGESHIPFILKEEMSLPRHARCMISAARCARASYRLHGTEITSSITNDVGLYKSLVLDGHMGPLEHQAFTSNDKEYYANFSGWIQLRSIYNELAEYEPFEIAYDAVFFE
jgi:hypothetical protein